VDSLFALRPPTEDDHAFIGATLYHQLRANGFAHGVSSDFLRMASDRALAGIFGGGSGWTVLVAAPVGDHGDEVAGWAIYRGNTVLAAYVKGCYRGMGVWRLMRETIGLVPGGDLGAVLWDPSALYHARKKYRVRHLPFLILELMETHV
jgi:hypothetical protein